MISKCNNPSCVSDFQDKQYGQGMRVMNPAFKGGGHSCTICGRNSQQELSKKKK